MATSQIGYQANPDNSNKYNKEYYGYECGYAWCVVFVWWVFYHCGLPNLFYGGKKTASCGTLFNYYKSWGQIVTSKIPQPGDLVEFTFDGVQHCHIGICESFDGTYVTTIDGNTSETASQSNGGQVLRRKRNKSCIYGLKAEFFIPLMVNKLITEGTATCEVLDTTSKWFGVTYAADREDTVNRIQKLVDEGVYPNKLF